MSLQNSTGLGNSACSITAEQGIIILSIALLAAFVVLVAWATKDIREL